MSPLENLPPTRTPTILEALEQRAREGARSTDGAADAPAGQGRRAEFEQYFPGLSGHTPTSAFAPRADFARVLAEQAPATTGQLSGDIPADIAGEISRDPERKRLYDAALDFQGIFVGQMLKAMRKNLHPENDLLDGGHRQRIFEDMLFDEYSKQISHGGGYDLAAQMYRQLSTQLPPVPETVGAPGANPPAHDSAVLERAIRQYDTHSNTISTGELWNEKDWRP